MGVPVRGSRSDIPLKGEFARKALHLVVLVVPLAVWHWGGDTSLRILVPLAVGAISGDVLRWKYPPFAHVIDRFFGWMIRPSEQPESTGPVLNGATSILIAAVLTVFLFAPRVAAASIALFVVSDAAAALVGRRFGRHRLGAKATMEGSSAFIAAGLLVCAFIPGLPVWPAVGVVLVSAVLEAIPTPLNDNIFVPFAASAVLDVLLRLQSISL